MDAEFRSDNIFKTVQTIAQHLIRYLGIGVLAAIISISFADKVKATYMLSGFARAGTYIDSQWYDFLDKGQYYYLDKGQYNLLGELGYFLGHPFYPKLYEKDVTQKIGFTHTINKGWFIFLGEQFPIDEDTVGINNFFNTDDYIYRQNSYLSDKGQYNYLEKRQYDFIGGLTYSFNRPDYRNQLKTGTKTSNVVTNPEPSTIGFLGLGAIAILRLRKKNRTK
ncbi:MAG: PEP-CTERM sorting domain-containing protein [Planctomycetes bacterium]|nr:PEP-CTERM sorting domain-containing protein [Planctomycetota bacterium]